MIQILHLLDDGGPGGVTRFLARLKGTAHLAGGVRHAVVIVPRGRLPKRFDADLVVSHLSVSWRTLPALSALRARAAHLPLVHVEHSYSGAFAEECVRAPARFQALLGGAYALFDRVVAVSGAQAEWLAGTGLVGTGALRVIPPVTDLGPFLALGAPHRPARRFGAIGRFDRQKGLDILIDAFRATTDPALTLGLTGDGPERADLVRRAAGDPRITFAPFTSTPERTLAALDAVAMPSRWEPYGLAALEARAASRPLLVSAGVDGLEEHARAGAIRVGRAAAAWTAAIEDLARAVPRDRIAAARADAAGAMARSEEGWDRLIGELCGSRARAA
ncbi:glycosyltransferase [Roseivivax isoporae]|uniref:Glycosyl transferase n=1 Tax=Roseivivax isoporae LMG 25204 TaxID=1449351 RepID=X7F7Z9_9RHOB|nr:glycosyltransferase [Roseivivax isoporae]ETX28226.1 glycosyl transferase [Roseivivax isoporae LMG 25204]